MVGEFESERVKVKSYRDLKVWQKSMDFVEMIYVCTERFPKAETYGIISQIRRAAVSLPSNIAEGSVRKSTKEFIRFVNMAYGSVAELETQVMISRRLNFLAAEEADKAADTLKEIGLMLASLRNSLKARLRSTESATQPLELLNS